MLWTKYDRFIKREYNGMSSPRKKESKRIKTVNNINMRNKIGAILST